MLYMESIYFHSMVRATTLRDQPSSGAALDVRERFRDSATCFARSVGEAGDDARAHRGPERTLELRKQESAKCHQLIEHHLQNSAVD
jgi:hypothetical protein